jgi:serine protease inhibitor ecotin
MMHRYIQLLTLGVLVIFASVSFADSDIMKPYPLPEAGYDRMVIHLEPLGNEDLRKVGIFTGSTDLRCLYMLSRESFLKCYYVQWIC